MVQQQQQQQQHSSHWQQSKTTSRWHRTQVRLAREVQATTLRPNGQRPIRAINELESDSKPAPNVINGKLRGQVTLRCSLKPLERDHDEVSLILWYKDSSMVPIFSVDARASPVLEARHKPGTWLEGRSTLRFDEETDEDEDELENSSNKTALARRRRSIGDIDEDLEAELGLAQLETESWNGSPQAETSFESVETQRRPAVIQSERAESGRRRRRRRRDEARPKHLVAKLTVDSLSSEDNGFYKCKVDFRRSKSRLQQLELKITVPAEKPLIRDLTSGSPRVVKNNIAGPHPESARVSLECETSGGYPEPSLTWWRDGLLVDDSHELISATDGQVLERRGSGGVADNELTMRANERRQQEQSSQLPIDGQQQQPMANRVIRNRLELVGLTRDDLLANYSCQASNSKLGDPPTSYVMIDMNLRPTRVQIDSERPAVLAGKPLEVTCRVFGSRPAALVSWHLNKARLATTSTGHSSGQHQRQQVSERVSSDSNVTTSVLTFTPQVDHSGKLLTCRAENGFKASKQHQLDPFDQPAQESGSSGGGPLEDSWKLEVHYLPRVRLTLGEKLANRQAVQVGHDVYFECASQAEPAAHELRWWFEGKELETNVTRGVIISNQSLVLQRVGRHQRGRYTCSAVNEVGESRSNSVLLRIQHEPVCRDTHFASGPATSSNRNGFEDDLRLKQSNDVEDGERQRQQQQVKNARHKILYGVARSESVKVYCHVEADPSEPISYKWAFVASRYQPVEGLNSEHKPSDGSGPAEWLGQQVVYLNASLITNTTDNNPLISVLEYTPKSELDYGSLLCWAQNSLGQQLEPCVYQVVPAERPEPLRNCRLVNATDSQLAIGCEPGYDGGIDQSFHMEIYEVGRTDQLVANLTNSVGLTSYTFSGSKPKLGGESVSSQDQAVDSLADTKEQSAGPPSSDLDLFDSEAQDQPDAEGKTMKTQTGQQHHQFAASLVSESQTSPTGTNSSRQQKQRHSTGQPPGQSRIQSDQAGGASLQRSDLRVSPRIEAFFLTEPHQLSPATSYLISVYSSNSKGTSKPLTFTASTSSQQSAGVFNNFVGVREGRRQGGGRPSDQSSSALITEVLALSWSPFLLVCAVTVLIFVLFASITFALIKYVDLANLMATGTLSSNQSSGMANGQSNASSGNFDAGSGGGQQATAERYQKVNGFDKTLVSSASSTASGTTNSELANSHKLASGNHFQRLDHDQSIIQTMTTSPGGRGDLLEFGQAQQQRPQAARFVSATLSRLTAAGTQNLPLARVIAIGANGSEWPSQLTSSPLNGCGGELEIPLNGVAALNPKRASLLNGAYLRAKIQQLTSSGQLQPNQQQHSTTLSAGSPMLRHSNSDNFLNQSVEAVALAATTSTAAKSKQPIESPAAAAQNWFQCRAPHYQAAYWTAPCGGTLPRTLANQSGGQQQPAHSTTGDSYYQLESPAYGYLKVLGGGSSGGRQLASHNHLQHHQQHVLEPGGQQHFVELPPPPQTLATTGEGAADSSASFSSSTTAATATGSVFNKNHVSSASPVQATANCSPLQLHANNNSTATATPMANNNGAGPVEHLLISGKQYIHQTRPISFNEQQQVQLTSLAGNHQACSTSGAACCGQQTAYKQPVPHLPNAIATTATNCCLIVDDAGQLHRHNQQQRLQSSTLKTSDLGEEDDDDNDDDHRDVECNGLNETANNNRHNRHQSTGSSTAFNVDSDGMSSQGTRGSSLATSTHPTSTTLGSPSSGYGPETICDHLTTTPVGGGSEAQQQHQPDQQLVRCNPLKPPSSKLAGLRQTRKSMGHFEHQNGLTLDNENTSFSYIYNQDLDLDNNLDQTNLAAAAQFYLLQDNGSEPMMMMQHSNGSMSTLIRLANKSRVRLVTPSNQPPNAISCGPLDQITTCNSVANHHNSQSRRRATQKSQENRPNDGYDDETDVGDLATSQLDLQTDV